MKLNYRSYLLRIWQINSDPPKWVASLEDPHTHKVIQLNSLEALLPFLREIIERKNNNPAGSDEVKEQANT